MPNTPILDIVQVAPNQNQKEATINTAIAVLEAAISDAELLTVSGTATVSKAAFTRNFHLRVNATAATVMTLPVTPRFFAVSNEGAAALTIRTPAEAASTVVVEPGIRALLLSDGVDVYAVTSGMGQAGGFGAFAGMADASAGQVLRFDGAAWGPADLVSEHAFSVNGGIVQDAVLYRKVITQPERLFSDFNGSRGIAEDTASSATTLRVFKGPAQIGVITFAPGQAQATFSTDRGAGSTTVSLLPGDVLVVRGPEAASTLGDVAVTLKGVIL